MELGIGGAKGLSRRIGRSFRSAAFRAPMARLLRHLWKPPETVYQHLLFDGVFPVEIEGATLFIHHFGFRTENELFWGGLSAIQERVSLATWARLAKNSSVILDVGANTGLYALVAKAVNPRARVIAFEPVPRMYRRLEQNVRLNRFDIVAEMLAVSNAAGVAVVYDTPGEQSLQASLESSRRQSDSVQREVSTCRIDAYVQEKGLGRVDLVKIDVEGHEPAVVEGMGECVRAYRPALLIEIQTEAAAQAIAPRLGGLSYVCFDIDENGPPRRLTSLERRSSYWNYLLCPEDVACRAGIG